MSGVLDDMNEISVEGTYSVSNDSRFVQYTGKTAAIAEFEKQVVAVGKKASRMATLFKVLDVSSSVSIICLGILISIASLQNEDLSPETMTYVGGVLGALVGGIEGMRRMFQFSGRGNVFQRTKGKCFSLRQKVKKLHRMRCPEEEIYDILDKYSSKLAILDENMYDSQYMIVSGGGSYRSTGSGTYTQASPYRSPISGMGEVPMTYSVDSSQQ